MDARGPTDRWIRHLPRQLVISVGLGGGENQREPRSSWFPGRTRRKPLTPEDRAWLRGFATALGTLARPGYDNPDQAADIAHSSGITLADFRQARVESFDVAPFRKALREREAKAKAVPRG